MQKTAVGYIRTSTKEQLLSVGVQIEQIKSLAQSNNATLLKTFLDLGVSASKPRPELSKAINTTADLLIVASRDRIARDRGKMQKIEKFLFSRGMKIISTDSNASTADLIAEAELKLIRDRTSKALQLKKSKGERVGKIPYGYQLAPDGIHLEECQAEQFIIEKVKYLRALGYSLRAIVKKLAQEGFRSTSGNPFGLTQIARMSKSTPYPNLTPQTATIRPRVPKGVYGV